MIKVDTHSTTITFEDIAPAIRRVESDSEPGTSHTVIVACDCAGFRFRGRCWHVQYVAAQGRR